MTRLTRRGYVDPTAQIVALAEEIENLRAKIRNMDRRTDLLDRLKSKPPKLRLVCSVYTAVENAGPPESCIKREMAEEIGRSLLEYGLIDIKTRELAGVEGPVIEYIARVRSEEPKREATQ
jgi:hypothetical protein